MPNRTLRPMRLALSLLPLFAMAALAWAYAFGRPAPLPPELAAAMQDRPLPQFALPPTDGLGGGLSDGDLKGQVSLLNVFAAWCPPCRAEHPLLMRIAQGGAVPIYGMNWQDRPGAGRRFLESHGNPYIASGADREGALGPAFGITSIPRTYVIDANGHIRYMHSGRLTEEIWRQELLPVIRKLEAES